MIAASFCVWTKGLIVFSQEDCPCSASTVQIFNQSQDVWLTVREREEDKTGPVASETRFPTRSLHSCSRERKHFACVLQGKPVALPVLCFYSSPRSERFLGTDASNTALQSVKTTFCLSFPCCRRLRFYPFQRETVIQVKASSPQLRMCTKKSRTAKEEALG